MRKLLLIGVGSVLLSLLPVIPVAAATAGAPGPLTLAVYGDAPYGTSPSDTRQFDATPGFVDSVNADPKVDLVLQVGDIHSGKQYCTEAYDRAIATLWARYQDPVVYTPGDNEWADCNKKGEGGGAYNPASGQIDYVLDASGNPVDYAKGDPVANLDLVRSTFFPTPGRTLGMRKQSVISQAQRFDPAHPSDAKYVENVMWEQSKVMFATINLPGGSNNDTDVWYGAPTMTAAQAQEVDERTGATLRWLDAVFAQAKADGVEAVLIGAQADMWDNEKGPAHQAAYEPFVKSLAEHTAAFGKPVLLMNGDSHGYQADNPLAASDPLNFVHPGYDVPNFRRLVVHGSTAPLEYLRLTVDTSKRPVGDTSFGPFSWERVVPQPQLSPVPAANTRTAGFSPPDVLSPELARVTVAQGSMRMENGTAAVPYYGYNGNGPMLPLPGAPTVEANKTEPDKNTYLVLSGQRGADPAYDYGTHFLFQGHELGAPGYITRINLDADAAHRITLLATADSAGTPLPNFDGSTWDPWAQRLLFTAEKGSAGGVWQATLDVPSAVEDISGSLGRGGYEGIQNDSDGNLTIVEDVGGATDATGAKKPNSFVYRFKPDDPRDLRRGKLQVLQLASLLTPGQPFAADTMSPDVKDLHTYGRTFPTAWLTIHDTAVDGTTPFDANALAKSKGATPFKRPENGQFRPGSGFREFYFDETGDTNATSQANAEYGGWSSLLRLTQTGPSADRGELTMVYKGDQAHTGFDNMMFISRNELAVVEDAGDGLHAQRNALDSGFVFNLDHPYSTGIQPVRFLAQGRDPSATIDSAIREVTPPVTTFKNDGDNEITGLHTSDGDPGTGGILGARVPVRPFDPSSAWRTFYTGQHGDNVTSQLISNRARSSQGGYWMLDSSGVVYPFGDAVSYGNGPAGAVGLQPTPSKLGYWVVTGDGVVSTRGDAQHFGDRPSLRAGERVASISAPPDGGGYWLFTSLGRVFAYGIAPHVGDLAGVALAGPVLDSTATPSGRGYYMVASDGGIFAFGDAVFAGSTGGTRLNAPVMSLAPDPDGKGYWLVASDGGVFAFDAPFLGSLGSTRLNRPVSGIVADGNGYLLVAEDGGVFVYGPGASFRGSLGSSPPPDPVIAIAAL